MVGYKRLRNVWKRKSEDDFLLFFSCTSLLGSKFATRDYD